MATDALWHRRTLPGRVERLWELATNMSWTWNRGSRALFKTIDPFLWRRSSHNPVEILRQVSRERLEELAGDSSFLERYDALCETAGVQAIAGQAAAPEAAGTDACTQAAAEAAAQTSTEAAALAGAEAAANTDAGSTWFARRYPELTDSPTAYFCAEFALHESIPIYSGGLGVLAGDHLKAASDMGVPLVAVGLMYARGFFDQTLAPDGWQEDAEDAIDPRSTPLERVESATSEPWLTWIYGAGRRINIGVWRVRVGSVTLYLLDTDLESNDPADRGLSHQLYAGGANHRLRQEALLGVGGVRVLGALGIEPMAWHANEGHAAFMLVERVRLLIEGGMSFSAAVAKVRASSVFTTHTPVPAGHDVFSHAQMREWTGEEFWERIQRRDDLLDLGRHPAEPHGDRFHMTAAAIRLSKRVNGVSRRHGIASRQIWQGIWDCRSPEEAPIGHVTNGVHLATWMNGDIMGLLDGCLPRGWRREEHPDDPSLEFEEEMWKGIRDLPAEAFWRVHQRLKFKLLDFMREEARRRWRGHWPQAAQLVGAGTLMSPFPLTIGFARRFATYKRADLLFRDRDRLRALLLNPRRPVQLVFAGKAHPRDEDGKRILQRVYQHTRDAKFEGRIAFLEDYGLHAAHCLVAGVDLWLNIPRVPLEACGTSGMKAALNGVPQLSTTDGWWEEGFEGDNGWIIPRAPEGCSPQEADEHDAGHLFRILEDEVVPLFYDRPGDGTWRDAPAAWVERARRAIEVACARFTASGMVREYARDYYVPALRSSALALRSSAPALRSSEGTLRSSGRERR